MSSHETTKRVSVLKGLIFYIANGVNQLRVQLIENFNFKMTSIVFNSSELLILLKIKQLDK